MSDVPFLFAKWMSGSKGFKLMEMNVATEWIMKVNF